MQRVGLVECAGGVMRGAAAGDGPQEEEEGGYGPGVT